MDDTILSISIFNSVSVENISIGLAKDLYREMVAPPVMWRSILILTINSVLGSAGNSVVIMVYGGKRGGPGSSSDTFIISLACLDFAASLFYMPGMLLYFLQDNSLSIKLRTYCEIATQLKIS